jgi:hypothetical protein
MMILVETLQLDVSGAAVISFLPRSSWAHLKFELHHPPRPHPCTVAKVCFTRDLDLFLLSRSILIQLLQSVWGQV